MNWTKSQAEAISYRGDKNVLISAAAGSGKTAVLVERIIQMILDPDEPVSVDEILVLTFTNAAASEMKLKIASAIEKKLREQPDNKRLAAQAQRVTSADISTVHAFAQKVISNNIHRTDIPVGFSICSEPENDLIISEALSDCLERYYERIDTLSSFSSLTIGHGGIKNDSSLRNIILSIYKFSQSLAAPAKWLNDSVREYKRVYKTGSIRETVWERSLLSETSDLARQLLDCYREINKTAESALDDNHRIRLFYLAEEQMIRPLAECESADEYFAALKNLRLGRKPAASKADKQDPYISAALEKISRLRDNVKTILKNPLLSYTDEAEISKTIAALYPEMRTLKNIVLMLRRRHRRIKLSRSALDFNDLEHTLIGLLLGSDGNPTEFCKTLGKKYKEIFVDEYQDTNNIQDTIFRLLSGGRGNIFMVGDVKQSIYKFRNASPELFLEKYSSYRDDPGSGRLITLSDNFRSRSSVVDAVNYLFERIMTKETGGLDYTGDERLNCGASYPASSGGYNTEVLFTDVRETNPEADKNTLEARTIAERILRLVLDEKLQVLDADSGKMRSCEFGDIAVLMRYTSRASAYESVFREYGIPVASSSSALFDSVEVGVVLSFLKIIDNPLQDIPLIAVMRSPIFGFTADELAAVRSRRRGYFYLYVKDAAEKGDTKSAGFINALEALRRAAKYMGIHEIIYKICYELGYLAIAEGMRGGEIRRANLKLLLKYAEKYEQNSLRGLFDFMDYLKNAGRFAEVSGGTQTGLSAVTISTVHKSKGLEYPIVILADTEHSVSVSESVLCDEKAGIALDYVDAEKRIKYPSLPMALIKQKKSRESRAEEIRLLYVAMTRAKEKLIMSCTNAGRSKAWLRPVLDSNSHIFRQAYENTVVFRDWIVLGFADAAGAKPLRKLMESDISELETDGSIGSLTVFNSHESSVTVQAEQKTPDEADSEHCSAPEGYAEHIKEIIEYTYPHRGLTRIPLKLSVSEIKRSMNETMSEYEGEYTPVLSSIADRSFRSGNADTAAQAGTFTHFVMQHIDPLHTSTEREIDEQLSALISSGTMTQEQLDMVDTSGIKSFFETGLAQRIRTAAAQGGLRREFGMLFPISADKVYSGLDCGGDKPEIIVQGKVDCFFFEHNGIVLIDYKTDSCSADTACIQAEKYRVQLELYANGLEQIWDMRVKEKIIYFLKPKTAVHI
ncbi:MAG TPA: helicase-exonuclease AddAB subunit AddA [Candidatus Monoglobus merdigallinarum]|uniref:DNA 3'-5' helicase n=1 Tax=Candidatus Monoglobus merdigallinarum TaxID=2838698 RepID=A0A9D1PP69_9FIRM|nr:helicase-exonuclease AddAB subunit AddA [Candidatus Monoglobus merdigallinarum]